MNCEIGIFQCDMRRLLFLNHRVVSARKKTVRFWELAEELLPEYDCGCKLRIQVRFIIRRDALNATTPNSPAADSGRHPAGRADMVPSAAAANAVSAE